MSTEAKRIYNELKRLARAANPELAQSDMLAAVLELIANDSKAAALYEQYRREIIAGCRLQSRAARGILPKRLCIACFSFRGTRAGVLPTGACVFFVLRPTVYAHGI